jgi:hypothetical protein
MFKSIQYLKYLEYNLKTDLYLYLFKIIDDDFEEETVGTSEGNAAGENVGAVINCYSKRNLNVPKNLLLFFMFIEKQHGSKFNSIRQQIEFNMKHQSLFPKYKEEIESYLSLI